MSFSCNTSITQDAKIRLVSDVATFSNQAIKTDNATLGVFLKYKGKVVSPFETFPIKLINGGGQDTISFSLVRSQEEPLKVGKFNASATLIIESV